MRWIRSTLLAGACLLYLFFSATSLASEQFLLHFRMEKLAGLLRWCPDDARLWSVYGRDLLSAMDTEKAIQAYSRQLALDPFDPAAWGELSSAYSMQGDDRKAEAALTAGLAAVPKSPSLAWRYANLLVLTGRAAKAPPYARVAASANRELSQSAFHLGWKILPNGAEVLRQIVPDSIEGRWDYLRFMIATRRASEAYGIWAEVRNARPPEFAKAGTRYVEALVDQQQPELALKVWDEVLRSTGRTAAKPEGELLTNGDFEEPILDGGFDWYFERIEGVRVDFDDREFQHGSQSLRLTFDGSSNPDFQNVWQKIPLVTGRRYRLSAFVRTEDLTSDSGVRVCAVGDGLVPAAIFKVCGKSRLGTEPWTREEIEFTAAAPNQLVGIALCRPHSARPLNNQISGRFWLDNVSLTPLPESGSGSATAKPPAGH